MSRLTMRQPTLSFAIHLHGRLVVSAPFPYLFGSLRQPGSAPASLVSGQDREGLLACIILDGMLRFALHVPKPMFVFAFEGALFAFIVNGDRFVLFALLPRRKPRTSRQCSRLIILVKELNLTTGGYSDFPVPFDRWHGFLVYC